MSDANEIERLHWVFQRQKSEQTKHGAPDYAQRRDRIERALVLLECHGDRLCEAMHADFGGRPRCLSLGLDVLPATDELKYARKHLKRWMANERRRSNFPFGLLGGKSSIHRDPKGVIGNLATWNFPLNIAMVPMAAVFAGGNRYLIKMHEYSASLGQALHEAVKELFDESECAIFNGGYELSLAFTQLPLDHLLYTGSTTVGKKVMEAAARNLTPVTLELGGKCPSLISRTADIEKATTRIVYAKLSNAGQICLAPDYLLVPKDKEDAIVAGLIEQTRMQFPDAAINPDYTAIISDVHYARLQGLIEDARQQGAKVTVVDGEAKPAPGSRKLPLHILQNLTPQMKVMQEEIFGPLLPVLAYDHFQSAIDGLKGKDKPLASYYFGNDAAEKALLMKHVPSGGTVINDALYHALMHELPFGGAGSSGIGRYHGKWGFDEFTHARATYEQGWFDLGKMLRPPFGKRHEKLLSIMRR